MLERALRPLVFAPGPNYALSVDGATALKTEDAGYDATVVGPALQPGVPLTIRIVHTESLQIMVGAAPANIIQFGLDNYQECGFYMCMCNGTKCSEGGVNNVSYHGARVPDGSTVGVLMDASRNISFLVDGVNRGVAYTVPAERGVLRLAVLLYHPQDSVQLVQ
jgi:hypothetical protein